MRTGKALLAKLAKLKERPLVRGIVSYAVIWPTGSLIHQKLEGRKEIDYYRVARFLIFGSLYVAPTLNLWMSIARTLWPLNTMSSVLTKALVEQVTYTPFAMVSFYFGMTLLEGKGLEEAKAEVMDKFFPTYKVGVCVWPVLQTINYRFVAEKNRVAYVSVCSLAWTTFLAYMKHLEGSHFKKHVPVSSSQEYRPASSDPSK